MRTLIGLVGFGSVGKDTVSRYLVDKFGFTHVSSGDLIRAYMTENKLGEQTRDALQKVINELREKNGGDYLVRIALENASPRLVISGLRAIPEVERIKKEGGLIIAVTAPVETRYQWALSRKRATDKITFEEFKAIEVKEMENQNLAAQNIKAVMAMADFTINNSGSRDQLFAEINRIMGEIIA